MTLDKLKVAARQHEQRDEWRAAIDLYRQAIRDAEGGSEGADPQIYNRIGDLEHKTGEHQAACDAWEQGATRYAEQGFFNNAIALCGKILRLDASRVRTYLDLARYHARKRVIYDVSLNLRAYLDGMARANRFEPAQQAIEQLGREFGSWLPMQDLVDELLGRAREPEAAHSPASGSGDSTRGLVFLDTAPLTLERASEGIDVVVPDVPASGTRLDLEPVDLGLEPTAATAADLDDTSVQVEGFVDTEVHLDAGPSADAISGLIDVQHTAQEVGFTAPVDGLDSVHLDEHSTAPESGAIEGLEATSFDQPADAIALDDNVVVGGDLVFLDVPSDLPGEGASNDGAAAAIEPAAEPDRNDPLGARVTAHALLEHGDRAGGIAALERSLALYAEGEQWMQALQVSVELIEAEPLAIHRYQARVEIAARLQDPARLCDAYSALGDALLREGSSEKAVAVFRRVLELDEHNEHARTTLRSMAPERVTPAGDDGFIDFGAMVNDDVGPRSTRMRTETTAISPDEDETFKEALAEFKRAIDQNLPVEEHQAHYDLGIAFREMGLMDEAISEFQKALRAPESRMRASEALGQLFFEQGRPGVAEAVLRGVERGPESDADKIGVLYWLGRSMEAQGRAGDAQSCYERVLAVDVSFHDAAQRVTQIASERNA